MLFVVSIIMRCFTECFEVIKTSPTPEFHQMGQSFRDINLSSLSRRYLKKLPGATMLKSCNRHLHILGSKVLAERSNISIQQCCKNMFYCLAASLNFAFTPKWFSIVQCLVKHCLPITKMFDPLAGAYQ